MKVLITDNAYNDINEFVKISKSSERNLNSYINSLLNYSLTLANFPEMGKHDFYIQTKLQKYSVRKLVYKQHKILYYVDTDVHIIGILHTKINTNEYVKRLKRFIEF